jgi:hypothetical protein
MPAQYIPSGVALQRTSRKIEDQEWERAKSSRDLLRLQSFVSRFPKSRHVRAADKMIAGIDSQERSRSAEAAKPDETKPITLVPTGRHTVRAVPVEQPKK